MHLIQEAFGESCDLYKDVLQCPRDANAARLRKAYYRRALHFHPDKQQQPSDAASRERSQLCFQAISLAYQLLKESDTRAAYDESGEIPDTNDADHAEGSTQGGAQQWKAYFDQIFGKVTTSDIDKFAQKYKCSDEERRDVVKQFRSLKGNLNKMLEFVMLSQPHDVVRWVEDYLRPAFEDGEELGDVPKSYQETMEKTLKQVQKKIAKEEKEEGMQEDDDAEEDADATDTEESSEEDIPAVLRKRKSPKKAKAPPVKAKPTKTKKKSKKNDMTDLVAQIRNKKRGGATSSVFASLGSRYGVADADADHDPMNDEEFAKIQARLKKNSR